MSLKTEAEKYAEKIARFDPELPAIMESMSTDELKARVLQSQLSLQQNARARANDQRLAQAVAQKKRFEAPYKEAKEHLEPVVQLGLLLLDEKGAPLGEE
jgi:hypothetical protein